MGTLQDYMKFRIENNHFAKHMGMELTEMKEGYALCRVRVQDFFYNPIRSVHGGVIFSLADMTAGSAAASYGIKVTTMDASFSFLAPAMASKELIGEATEIKHGRSVSVYDVTIKDEADRLIAKGTFSFFSLGVPLLESDRIAPGGKRAEEIPAPGKITDFDLPSPDGKRPV